MLCVIFGKKRSRGWMEDQASSHNFLSTIFGIFGIFWIEICGRKKVRRKFFDRKNFDWKNNFSKNNFSRPKKIHMKKSMKNENFEISIFSSKNQNFKIFIFHWLFHRKIVWSRNRKIIFSIEKKFDQKIFDENFFDHIFRLKKSQRFQKSHLENCAMRPGPPSSLCFVFFSKMKQDHVDLA